MRAERGGDIVGGGTRRWVSVVLGERVVAVERLVGGMSTELVCLATESGRRAVLRRTGGRGQ